MRIVGFAGSLRKGSFNKMLLRIFASKAEKAGARFEIIDLKDIPLYNQDVEEKGFPPAVAKFRSAIAKADGVAIATPEYNRSCSSVVKNAVDWASREPNVFKKKPVAIMGASTGRFGTISAQTSLRTILNYLDSRVLNSPEVFIPLAQNAFDKKGLLKDADEEARVEKLAKAFVSENANKN